VRSLEPQFLFRGTEANSNVGILDGKEILRYKTLHSIGSNYGYIFRGLGPSMMKVSYDGVEIFFGIGVGIGKCPLFRAHYFLCT